MSQLRIESELNEEKEIESNWIIGVKWIQQLILNLLIRIFYKSHMKMYFFRKKKIVFSFLLLILQACRGVAN